MILNYAPDPVGSATPGIRLELFWTGSGPTPGIRLELFGPDPVGSGGFMVFFQCFLQPRSAVPLDAAGTSGTVTGDTCTSEYVAEDCRWDQSASYVYALFCFLQIFLNNENNHST